MTHNTAVRKGVRMRTTLIIVGLFLFCMVVGNLAGAILALATNYIFGGMGFNLQVQAPLAYKALMYCIALYPPFLTLTVITASLRRLPGRGLPASMAYLVTVCLCFFSGTYLARGMEIESRPTYALVLFVPAAVIIAVGLLLSRRRRPDITQEQQP